MSEELQTRGHGVPQGGWSPPLQGPGDTSALKSKKKMVPPTPGRVSLKHWNPRCQYLLNRLRVN